MRYLSKLKMDSLSAMLSDPHSFSPDSSPSQPGYVKANVP